MPVSPVIEQIARLINRCVDNDWGEVIPLLRNYISSWKAHNGYVTQFGTVIYPLEELRLIIAFEERINELERFLDERNLRETPIFIRQDRQREE